MMTKDIVRCRDPLFDRRGIQLSYKSVAQEGGQVNES